MDVIAIPRNHAGASRLLRLRLLIPALALLAAGCTLTIQASGTGSGTVAIAPARGYCTIAEGIPDEQCTQEIEFLQEITLVATAASGSVFAGWRGDCGSVVSSVCIVKMDAHKTVTVRFDPIGPRRLTISGLGDGSGRVVISPGEITCTITDGTESESCIQDLPSNSVVTLTAIASEGWRFAAWLGDCAQVLGNRCGVVMNNNKFVAVAFEIETGLRKLTIQGEGTGNGSVTVGSGGALCTITAGVESEGCVQNLALGSQVPLTAGASQGSFFDGWSGACADAVGDVCTVRMNSDLTVIVVFELADGSLKLNLPANDLVWDPGTQRLYASVPSTAGERGNTLTPINPVTGELGPSVFVGSEPGKLARSDDGQYIYVGLNGAAAVRRFDLASQTAGLQFELGSDATLGTYYVEDMAVLPGAASSVAVARRFVGISPRHAGVAIYDEGIQRAIATPRHQQSNSIAFSASSSLLFGYNNETTEFGLRRMAVDESGVTVLDVTANLITGFDVRIKFAGGLIYATSGRVVNPETLRLRGTFAASGPVEPDVANRRVYFVHGHELKVFHRDTFVLLGSLTLRGLKGSADSLVRWGEDGLAFRTTGGQVVILRTSLIQMDGN